MATFVGSNGLPRYTAVRARWSERLLLGLSSCSQPILGSAGSRERQRDPPLPTYLDVGLLCPWVRSEGESESSVAAGPSAIHLGRGPQRSNSLSLHSHGISEETGGPAGCWRHLVASFFNYISEYLSRSPVVKGTGCIRVN